MCTRETKQIDDFLLMMKDQDYRDLIERAEEAMQGMLVLNGTGPKPVFVGIPPKWNENPCGVGGYTWTMSRLKYMVTLCKAFLLTKERRYLDKVESDLENWLDTVPPPPVPNDYESACVYHGGHHWRMLELGYRMVYTFPILRSVLRVYGSRPNLPARIDRCIADHAERISAGSHLLWPEFNHNHYTEEINGLLSAASMIPDHPKASVWMDQAIDGLEKASANQLTEDGAQVEGAAEYHTAVVINFCYAVHFAQQCGRRFSPAFTERIKRGIAFAIHTMSPDGNMMPFGDTDAMLYTPVQAAVLAYLLFRDDIYLATLQSFMDSQRIKKLLVDLSPWGFDHISSVVSYLEQGTLDESQPLLPTTVYQRQMDQYITRTGWDRQAAFLFFSCHSPIHYGNHAHMDQLGIIFGAYGKVLLQDPGRYTYKDCEDRHLYKSSHVHNVPTIDGRDAFEYQATFAYGPQREGSITAIMDADGINGASGTHHNYDPVIVSRSAALIDGKFLLIADTFEHAKGQTLKMFFHLNSTNVILEGTDAVTQDNSANLRIVPAVPAGDIAAEIVDGRLSDVFYHDYPSKQVVYSRTAQEDVETIHFIVLPYTNALQDDLSNISRNDQTLSFVLQGKSYCISIQNNVFSKQSFLLNSDGLSSSRQT